ncbi:MAG: cytochrome c biogenesis protein CcsA [Cyclobacteriaceae bacterium]
MNLRKSWWKWLGVILVGYTILGGLLFEVPRLVILNESIRNLYFHVTMWFGMITLLTASVVYSVRYLSKQDPLMDVKALEFANAGILFGLLGLVTGMLWATYTWGEPWSGDPKQNSSAIALLIYMAYLVLRNSLSDSQQRARISSVYNVFAYAAMIPLLFILPRMADSSLHPGNGGNPGFNYYDLDNKLRIVFYPAVIGWILIGVWVTTLRIRMKSLKLKLINHTDQ